MSGGFGEDSCHPAGTRRPLQRKEDGGLSKRNTSARDWCTHINMGSVGYLNGGGSGRSFKGRELARYHN